MTEPTINPEWPADALGTLLLIILVLVFLVDLGRSGAERLSVVVGSIRLRPPTLVPLADAESETAAQLLGGAISDYFAGSEQEPTL